MLFRARAHARAHARAPAQAQARARVPGRARRRGAASEAEAARVNPRRWRVSGAPPLRCCSSRTHRPDSPPPSASPRPPPWTQIIINIQFKT